ncbi:Uncharacterized protein APZ42_033644 [Daphnia magna]|uniref:HAT C-terminal dimerisation domain-containing protein n=1 Tax=Daphnia magna TaxID=35525 RepID=A0A164KWQ2_9CRUS|nr:Uncharacterized protein APZ42_033644 [Daphnia magna]
MLAITTDNASSNGTFIDHIIYLSRNTYRPFKKEYWIRCFAHVINLCVKSALDVMRVLLQKLRDLVVGIRSSPQRIEKFKRIAKYCEVEDEELDYEEDEKLFLDGGLIPTDLLPILDCPTRWSSTYFFLKRALKIKNALNEIAKEQELRMYELQEDVWIILSQVFAFLEDFAVVTTYVEASQYPTLSLVVPMYTRLLDQLEEASCDHSKHPLLVQGAAAGFAKLSSYYDKASPLVMAATFVDPRCKMKIQQIWDEYNTACSNNPTPSCSIAKRPRGKENSPIGMKSHVNTKSKINQTYISKFILGRNRTPVERQQKDELKEYEAEETEPADGDPTNIFYYWAVKSTKWPKLCNMAKDLLSIPATSAACERSFSAGKDVFGISRMSLNPETIEALVCLRSWYRAGLVNGIEVDEFIEDMHNN